MSQLPPLLSYQPLAASAELYGPVGPTGRVITRLVNPADKPYEELRNNPKAGTGTDGNPAEPVHY